MRFVYENAFGESIEFSKDSPFRLTDIQGLSENSIAVSEASSVDQIGSTLTGTKIQSKNLVLSGDFYFTPERRQHLINVLVPGKRGVLRYITGDLDVYLEVTPSTTPALSMNPVIQDFQFQLRASYSYWRERVSTVYDFTQIVSYFRFPRSFSSTEPWKISRATKNIILNIRNESTQESGFTLTFEAVTDVTSPEILNIETQQIIKLKNDFVLKAGDKAIITTYEDNKRCILLKSGIEFPAYKYLSDDTVLFSLQPGDNIIRYGANDNYEGLRAKIEFSRTLAGV